MGVSLGRNQAVGLGKESTKFTGVASTHWAPVSTFAYNRVVTEALDQTRLNNLANSSGAFATRKQANPTMTVYVDNDFYALVRLGDYGSVSSAAASGETIVYEHTFTEDNDIDKPSFTVNVEDPSLGDQRMVGCVLNSITERHSMDDLSSMDLEFFGRYPSAVAATPSFDVGQRFVGRMVSIKFAATVAGLSGATAVNAKSVEIARTFNVLNDAGAFRLGSADIVENYGRNKTTTITLGKFLENSTFVDYMISAQNAKTDLAMEIRIVDTGTTIGNASNPTIVHTFPKVTFVVEDTSDNDDIRMENITLTAHYDVGVEDYMEETVVTNLTASY